MNDSSISNFLSPNLSLSCYSRWFIVWERQRPSRPHPSILLLSHRHQGCPCCQWQLWPRPAQLQHTHILGIVLRGSAAREPERAAPSEAAAGPLPPARYRVSSGGGPARRPASQRARGASQKVSAGRQTSAGSSSRPARAACAYPAHARLAGQWVATGPRLWRQGERTVGQLYWATEHILHETNVNAHQQPKCDQNCSFRNGALAP